MKIHNKNSFLIALAILMAASNLCPMDSTSSNDENLAWVALAGAAIAGGAVALKLFLSYIHSQPTTFTNLPKEIQQKIMGFVLIGGTAESLEIAAKNIYSLSLVNKELNTFINSDQFLEAIPMLAERFNCDPKTVLKTVKTKSTQKLLEELNTKESFDMLHKAGF